MIAQHIQAEKASYGVLERPQHVWAALTVNLNPETPGRRNWRLKDGLNNRQRESPQ